VADLSGHHVVNDREKLVGNRIGVQALSLSMKNTMPPERLSILMSATIAIGQTSRRQRIIA
jgi:hypothetical protein